MAARRSRIGRWNATGVGKHVVTAFSSAHRFIAGRARRRRASHGV